VRLEIIAFRHNRSKPRRRKAGLALRSRLLDWAGLKRYDVRMNTILNAVVRLCMRAFAPGIAKSMKEDGQFDFRDKGAGTEGIAPATYINVENNGADVTLVCFAGMAALYAGMPKFEFRRCLTDIRSGYNFVWVRDVHRASYDLAPDGSSNGFAFFTKAIENALATLNSTYNVAIGASAGGAAAFAFSGVLPIHQVIAFNPGFPLDVCSRPEIMHKVLLDWKKLLRRPLDYFELVLLILCARYLWKRSCRLVGRENITDTLESYLRKQPPARATVFYSARSLPDTEQTRPLEAIPAVRLKPVDSGCHNCMGELKRRGELGALIHEEIRVGLAECLDKHHGPAQQKLG
jgi:hypothetical protein